MQFVAPDFARRIDLPGVGPCARPVDIDRSTTGFADLVSLRIYSFAHEMVIDGEAEEDEVFIVAMRGKAEITVDSAGQRVGSFTVRADGGPRAVYLPPHAGYRLSALADCDIAYARARPARIQYPEAESFSPDGDRLSVPDHALGMELVLATLAAGATHDLVANAGGLPERFVHIRSDRGGAAIIGSQAFGNWESGVFDDGERAALSAMNETIDVLTVSATARRRGSSGNGNDER